MLTHVGPRAKILTFPSMFYKGFHPYLVYVHATGELGTPAPLTAGYHYLRFIYAAGMNMSDGDASAWLTDYSGDEGFIRKTAEQSLDALRSRDSELDVAVSDMILGLADRSFWTLNHPSNAVLSHAASIVHSSLGTAWSPSRAQEILTSIAIPVHADVRQALGYAPGVERALWQMGTSDFTDHEVMRAHLAFYRLRPTVLAHALQEHSQVLHDAGLGKALNR